MLLISTVVMNKEISVGDEEVEAAREEEGMEEDRLDEKLKIAGL